MNETREELIIVAAHQSEGEAVEKAVRRSGRSDEVLVTGVGGAAMSWALQKRFSMRPVPSLVINAGIAGSYVNEVRPGDVVVIESDCFADMGVDDNGSFTSVFSANLADPDRWPFSDGRIHCTGRWFDLVSKKHKAVRGATVNMSSGSQLVIDRIRRTWNPVIETMEGAWFAYACAMVHAEWIAVRAISNMVEPRNTDKWNIHLALQNLEDAMNDILNSIMKP